MALSDLMFSDLFVTAHGATSWFKVTPDSMKCEPVPAECQAELADLRTFLKQESEKSQDAGFSVRWPASNGIVLRVQCIENSPAEEIYICRRFRLPPGPLPSLGMPAGVAEKLLSADLHEGLVFFSGRSGSGKTTTAASFIVDRLTRFGGVCWTVENPKEMDLQGRHGQGWCYQTEVRGDAAIGPAIRKLMRATPNIIFIGEIRDGLAAREAIAAAMSGHLVVATFHAADLASGLARLTRLAGEEARAALAESLRVGVHLSLHTIEAGKPLPSTMLTAAAAKGTGTPARLLNVEPLWVGGQSIDAIKSIVRDGDFHKLKSEIERQRRVFLNGNTGAF